MQQNSSPQAVPREVRRDALRTRRQGTASGLLAAALFFGGLISGQFLIMLAGVILLAITLYTRSRGKKRALAPMSPAHASQVVAEIKRATSTPLVSSPLWRNLLWLSVAMLTFLFRLR